MEAEQGMDPWYPREQWETFEPMLVSEGAFAAGMIFRSYLLLILYLGISQYEQLSP